MGNTWKTDPPLRLECGEHGMASLGLWLCGTSPRWELNYQPTQLSLEKRLLPRKGAFSFTRILRNGPIFVKTAVKGEPRNSIHNRRSRDRYPGPYRGRKQGFHFQNSWVIIETTLSFIFL